MQGSNRSASRPRLLLVEDEEGYRYVLAKELTALGYEVIGFPLAMNALDYLDLDPDIKFAVLDMRMPENTLTGFALARMMKYRDKGMNVVLITGHPNYLEMEEAASFGKILPKTDDVAGLARAIHARAGQESEALKVRRDADCNRGPAPERMPDDVAGDT